MSLNSLIKMPNVIALPPNATVLEAAKKMAEHLVGSVIVLDGEKLIGIFTERDLLNRVVAKDLDPKSTPLSQVMSKNVRSVEVEETVENLYNKMQETRCRHIPIVDGPKVIGVVTMRGILEWLTQEIKEENLFLKNYIQS